MKRITLLSAVLALGACGGPPALQIHAERPVHLVSGRPSLHVADAALAGGVPETALAITRGLLVENPRNVEAMVKQGEALAAMNRGDAAAETYRRALTIDPRSIEALIALGRVNLAAGQAVEAEAMFRRVVDRVPANAQAQNNLGIALDMQDRHADAQKAYHAALQSDPSMTGAEINLGFSYALSGDSVHALAVLQPLAADPDASEQARHDYRVALDMAGNPASASAELYADAPLGQAPQAVQAAR